MPVLAEVLKRGGSTSGSRGRLSSNVDVRITFLYMIKSLISSASIQNTSHIFFWHHNSLIFASTALYAERSPLVSCLIISIL